MAGEWVYRDSNNHVCQKPNGDFKTKVGDIWRCECGLLWRVTSCKGSGGQRDFYYKIEWVRHSGPIPEQQRGGRAQRPTDTDYSGIYASGTK